MQAFSKDDYEPILTAEKQALGSINITNLIFNEIGINSTQDAAYSIYMNDLNSGKLKMNYRGTLFKQTLKGAQVDNINENITDYKVVTVLLNETIDVQYNNSNAGYLLYAPKLTPFIKTQLYVKNNSLPAPLKLDEGNYSIEYIDSINFLKFDYKNFFKYNMINFTMQLLWEYNISIDNWNLLQYNDQNLILDEDEDYIVSPKFYYKFNLLAQKYNKTGSIYAVVSAFNLFVNLTIFLPDKEVLREHKFSIDSQIIPSNYLNAIDKSIYTDFRSANNTLFEVDFVADYEINFIDPVDITWGIDRLVEDSDTRERIYFPYILTGPQLIYVKDIRFIEDTIAYDQVISSTSLFQRIVRYEKVNVTEFDEEIKNSLIFSENATKREGIEIIMPFIIKNEICPFIIKYETERDLKIIITDNIRMPISGLDVKIYYYGELYGTYISQELSQPIGPTITDENGEILVKDVPNGNYTIKIYQGVNLIKEAEVSSYLEINYVTTQIIHFPIIVFIFSSIGGLIFILGLRIYLKQKKISR
jgi:hypothetical protein